MTINNLTVSIITPSFNQGRFIEETIQSVLGQNVHSLEYMVVDGGSTDETIPILEKYQDRLTWISEPDEGQAAAINKGFNRASGEIIGWLNSDDVYTPDAIKKVRHFFQENPQVDVVYGMTYLFDANSLPLSRYYHTEPWDLEQLKKRCFISQPAVFFRRHVLTRFGLLNEKLHFCLDYEYWLRVGLGGASFVYLPIVLAGARIYDETKSSRYCLEAYFETVAMLREVIGYIPAHWVVHYAIANAKAEVKTRHLHPSFIKLAWLNLWKTSGMHYQGVARMSFWLRAHTIVIGKLMAKLKQYTSSHIFIAKVKKIVRAHLYPRIGVLCQYAKPKPIYIPNRYNKPRVINKPLTISIVTPSFNQGHFLERTILSVINQQYPHLEYIIQDGESIDNSVAILQHYQRYLKHWETKKDSGQSNAINLGFGHATGEIMAYLNSDDVLLPGALHYVANYFIEHPEVDVVYGHRILINENDEEIGRWVLPHHHAETTTWVDYIPQETLFWRRRLWEAVGGQIDESFKYAMDWDLILRFQDAGAKFARLPRFLGGFRVHSQQKTTANAEIGAEEVNWLRARVHGRQVTRSEVHKKIRAYLMRHIVCHSFYRMGIFRY